MALYFKCRICPLGFKTSCYNPKFMLLLIVDSSLGDFLYCPRMSTLLHVFFLCRHLGAVNTITFFDRNQRIATTSDDKSIRIWEWYVVFLLYTGCPLIEFLVRFLLRFQLKEREGVFRTLCIATLKCISNNCSSIYFFLCFLNQWGYK